MPGRPPKAFGPEHTRADVIAYVRTLENELATMDALESVLAQMRCCRDGRCHLCPSCVTKLQIEAKPTPLTIVHKYVVSDWRQ